MAMENQPAANVFSVSSGNFPLPGQVRLPECRNQFPCWTSPCLVIINLRIHFCWLSFFGSSNPHSSPIYPCSSNMFPAINLPSGPGFPITRVHMVGPSGVHNINAMITSYSSIPYMTNVGKPNAINRPQVITRNGWYTPSPNGTFILRLFRILSSY